MTSGIITDGRTDAAQVTNGTQHLGAKFALANTAQGSMFVAEVG